MINIRECVQKYGITILSISYLDNNVIIDSSNGKYLLKKKDSNKKEIFSYLKQIHFDYFVPLVNDYNDYYELYPYYEDHIFDLYSKAKEFIYALSVLHLKTTSYVSYREGEIQDLYEEVSLNIDYMMKYYLDLQDYIEGLDFPNPAQYLLIKNISRFHYILRISKDKLEEWKRLQGESGREVLQIGKASLHNFRVGEKSYFVDFRDAKRGRAVDDLIYFYRSDFQDVDFSSLFSFYHSKYQLDKAELSFFYAMIAIPEKITFTKNHFLDTQRVRKVVDYVNQTLNFILEKDKENTETNENEFKE